MKKSRQIGIKAKLFFAFAAVSGTTVIAGAAAWLMFSQVRDLFHGVAGRNIPEIVETLGLQTDTQALAGSAPTLLAARSQSQRQQELTALKARQDGIGRRLDDIARTIRKLDRLPDRVRLLDQVFCLSQVGLVDGGNLVDPEQAQGDDRRRKHCRPPDQTLDDAVVVHRPADGLAHAHENGGDGPLELVHRIERIIVHPENPNG